MTRDQRRLAPQRLRAAAGTERSSRPGVFPERSRPHFQHSENCPSIFSPQPRQSQGFFTDVKGAKVFLRIALALADFSSSTTQSSGQQSMGGNSPAALPKSRFLVTHWMPNVTNTLRKWPIISGSLAQYTFFTLLPTAHELARRKAASFSLSLSPSQSDRSR